MNKTPLFLTASLFFVIQPTLTMHEQNMHEQKINDTVIPIELLEKQQVQPHELHQRKIRKPLEVVTQKPLLERLDKKRIDNIILPITCCLFCVVQPLVYVAVAITNRINS